ncbi:hypothetical protein LTR36_006165 [Oleoguttula mirabilis]|uniref:TATA-box-binding protein n=1 Tax=Oleoguttula mirabilis TaxID=1507867 RepID=A0AAV9JC48_9PEZI|nr:hypothetical protein LTR36_006165 [Oleoguttula mirabilis]
MVKTRRASGQIRYEVTVPTSNDLTFTGTGPTVSNVVAGMHLNCHFQLAHIAKQARNAVYRPKRFPACILRLRDPKATALVFEGGRVQVLGTKSIADARLAGRKFGRMLQKMGYQPHMTDFAVQNMVANADTKMLIRLEGLQARCWHFTRWDPEIFPGLIFYLMKPKMTMLIFARGKMVFLGARSREEIDEALRLVWPLLLEFKRE